MRPVPRYVIDSLLSGVLVVALLLYFIPLPSATYHLILIGIALLGAAPVAWGAVQALRVREWASMDMLASVALFFALISGEWASAVFIELMLAAARILGEVTKDRAEKSIRGLLKLRPSTATVEEQGSLKSVPIEQIKLGDIVVVDIGQRMPIDGVVLSGTAAVDESSLTGESLPIDKAEGSKVMSSTLVQSGSLRVQTTQVGKDTTLERVITLVESARLEKPKSQTLGERFGKIYLLLIFVGSALLLAVTRDVLFVLSVVLVVCADDVAIAIPIAYLRAIRSAARYGVIVKGSQHLETLGTLKVVVFDKTGTLTKGSLVLTDVLAAPDSSADEVVRLGMLAARRSQHPVSRAILAYAKEHTVPEEVADSAEERGGRGIVASKAGQRIVLGKKVLLDELGIHIPDELVQSAQQKSDAGKSISYIALDGRAVGCIAAADEVKHNASQVIAQLRGLGIRKVIMLTGDNSRVAAYMAKSLGVDEFYADLLPQDKVSLLKKFQSEEPVAMVGDGVNDAAALSIASVGIAMGGLGAEGTIESAQIVLMRDELETIPLAINLARMARRVSIQDFWIWGITNLFGLGLVFAGFIGPQGAAAYNFISDFFPLFNSARVRVITKL